MASYPDPVHIADWNTRLEFNELFVINLIEELRKSPNQNFLIVADIIEEDEVDFLSIMNKSLKPIDR